MNDELIPVFGNHEEAAQYFIDSAFGMGADMGLPLLDGLEYKNEAGQVFVSVDAETAEASWVERK